MPRFTVTYYTTATSQYANVIEETLEDASLEAARDAVINRMSQTDVVIHRPATAEEPARYGAYLCIASSHIVAFYITWVPDR